MRAYRLTHLSDAVLLRDLRDLVAQERTATAAVLAHIAEVDARKLYLPAAYPSLHQFCVEELRLSEDSAFKRIRAARAAREFPAIFDLVAEGRLHLSAVVCLAPYLTPENAAELLAAATHKRRAEIEQLLAERFPRLDVPAGIQALSPAVPSSENGALQLAPGPLQVTSQLAPGPVQVLSQVAPGPVEPRPKMTPLAPQRFALQVSIGQSTYEKLLYAQELLRHCLPSGDLEKVLDRALDALIPQLEKRKFAATAKPRPGRRRPEAGERFVPAAVKRAVWERDGGQCTFVSETGRRCTARTLLEFDHIDEVARGGRSTLDGMRLRCRAHNQYGAESTFGAEFMMAKRQRAQQVAAGARGAKAERAAEEARAIARARAAAAARAAAEARESAEARAAEEARAKAVREAREEVVPYLRTLGFRTDEARRAAALCDGIPDATLEERVRLALSYFHPRARTHRPTTGTPVSVSSIGGVVT